MTERQTQLKSWIATILKTDDYQCQPITGDASFRHYTRIRRGEESFIVCDSPPEKENNTAFYHMARALKEKGVCVPTIIAIDEPKGFMLLSDFGDDLLLKHLSQAKEDEFYEYAFSALLLWYQDTQNFQLKVPHFDQHLLKVESDRTEEWFFAKYLGLQFTEAVEKLLKNIYQRFERTFAAQPQVLVHRDFHSRNLMVLPDKKIGIIDFQDAVMGPITYDAISLFKDCYYVLPREKVLKYCERLREALIEMKLMPVIPGDLFFEYFEITGLQRHYKVLGIFARLFLRDGHQRYLADLPQVLQYILEASKSLPFLNDFHTFMENEVAPRLCAMQCHSQRA